MPEHALDRSAQDQVSKNRFPVRNKDDEISIMLGAEDFIDGISHADFKFGPYVSAHGRRKIPRLCADALGRVRPLHGIRDDLDHRQASFVGAGENGRGQQPPAGISDTMDRRQYPARRSPGARDDEHRATRVMDDGFRH